MGTIANPILPVVGSRLLFLANDACLCCWSFFAPLSWRKPSQHQSHRLYVTSIVPSLFPPDVTLSSLCCWPLCHRRAPFIPNDAQTHYRTVSSAAISSVCTKSIRMCQSEKNIGYDGTTLDEYESSFPLVTNSCIHY